MYTKRWISLRRTSPHDISSKIHHEEDKSKGNRERMVPWLYLLLCFWLSIKVTLAESVKFRSINPHQEPSRGPFALLNQTPFSFQQVPSSDILFTDNKKPSAFGASLVRHGRASDTRYPSQSGSSSSTIEKLPPSSLAAIPSSGTLQQFQAYPLDESNNSPTGENIEAKSVAFKIDSISKPPELHIVSGAKLTPGSEEFLTNPSLYFEYIQSTTTEPFLDNWNTTSVHSGLECVKDFINCSARASLTAKSAEYERCTCDPDCFLYGDCCWDAPSPHGRQVAQMTWACLRINDGKPLTFYVVDSCAAGWEDGEVQSHCEMKGSSDEQDNFHRMPVTSRSNNFTYRNVYCAVCNQATDLLAWVAQTRCRGKPSADYSNCRVNFVPPREMEMRKCEPGLVSTCSEEGVQIPDEQREEVKNKCALYFAPVEDTNGTVYKNKFCALCNGVSSEDFKCRGRLRWPNMRFGPSNTVPPFSILVDIDFTRGGSVVGMEKRCPPPQQYDPWKRVCLNITCGRLFEFKEGKCVPKRNGRLEVFPSNYMTSDCLKVQILKEDFSIDRNGKVNLTKMGTVLDRGRYELVSEDGDAILICVPKEFGNYVSKFGESHVYLTLIGTSLSLLSLFVKIVLYFVYPKPNKLPPKIVLFLSLSLLVAQSLFLFGTYKVNNYALCASIGLVMHYCFLSAFFWTNTLAYDIWRTFSSSRMARTVCPTRQMIRYCVYSWLSPMVIVAVAAILDWGVGYSPLRPQYGRTVCWISDRTALLVLFVIPLGVLLIANVIFFGSTAVRIRKTTRDTRIARENTSSKDQVRFVLYVKLALVMGLTWVFGLAAAFASSEILWCLFIIFNSIQGVYILFAFTRFRLPSRLRMRERLLGMSFESRLSATQSTVVSKM